MLSFFCKLFPHSFSSIMEHRCKMAAYPVNNLAEQDATLVYGQELVLSCVPEACPVCPLTLVCWAFCVQILVLNLFSFY